MNKVIMMGRLTKDVELRFVAGSGKALAKFTIAVQETKEKSSFHQFTAFGKTAEIIAQYHAKGDRILVTGKIVNNSYEKDGETKYTTELIVTEFNFCK